MMKFNVPIKQNSVTDALRLRDTRYRVRTSTWFRIRRKDGQWLRMDCEGWTTDKSFRWLGNGRQLKALLDTSEYLMAVDDWTVMDVTKAVRGYSTARGD